MGSHLVTGATGAVGGALVLRLLESTTDTVYCLVRGESQIQARQRLHDRLAESARVYGSAYEAHPARVIDVYGDVDRPHCGVSAKLPEITHFWHNVASVEGTRNALDLARTVGAQFNHVSTAYACSPGGGIRREVVHPDPAVGPNHYVRSKIMGEHLVTQSGLAWRILRPSIVVGHSQTLGAMSPFGLYGIAAILLRFRGVLHSTFSGSLRHRTIRLTGNPDSRVNFVPIDGVAEMAALCGMDGPLETVFHLTNPTPPTFGEAARAIFDWAGLREPSFVPAGAKLRGIDWAIDDALEFYSPYMRHDMDFVRVNTDAVAGDAGAMKMPESTMVDLLRWYGAYSKR